MPRSPSQVGRRPAMKLKFAVSLFPSGYVSSKHLFMGAIGEKSCTKNSLKISPAAPLELNSVFFLVF